MRARLAAAVLVALLTGCSPTRPTPSVASTPSSTAPAESAAAIDLLVPENAVSVAVDALILRVEPSRTAASTGNLVRGDVVRLVWSGPVEAEGAFWYYAIKLPTRGPGVLPALPAALPEEEFPLAGWIAAIDSASTTVAMIPPRCPETRDFANVSAMFPGERLACFGDASIVIDGSFGCVGCGGDDPGTFEPLWLAGRAGGLLSDPSVQQGASVPVQFPPGVDAPEADAFARFTGHFDDPRSSTCSITDTDPPTPSQIVAELCRQRFVIDSFKVLSVEEIPPPE